MLLRDHPEAAHELEAILDGLPDEGRVMVQSMIAHDNASIYAAQGGNVIQYQGLPQDVRPTGHSLARTEPAKAAE
jgi:hypothetical protein